MNNVALPLCVKFQTNKLCGSCKCVRLFRIGKLFFSFDSNWISSGTNINNNNHSCIQIRWFVSVWFLLFARVNASFLIDSAVVYTHTHTHTHFELIISDAWLLNKGLIPQRWWNQHTILQQVETHELTINIPTVFVCVFVVVFVVAVICCRSLYSLCAFCLFFNRLMLLPINVSNQLWNTLSINIWMAQINKTWTTFIMHTVFGIGCYAKRCVHCQISHFKSVNVMLSVILCVYLTDEKKFRCHFRNELLWTVFAISKVQRL